MEHVVSTAAYVFPTTCRNYYDPYQQKNMAPSMKTYTIRNEPARKPKKIDSLDITRNDPPDFRSNTKAPLSAHPARKSTSTSDPTPRTVPERISAPALVPASITVPAAGTTDKTDMKPVLKTVTLPTVQPLKPILKPAPAVLTDTQAVHKPDNTRHDVRLPLIHDASARYLPSNKSTPNISPSSSKSYRSTGRIIEPRIVQPRSVDSLQAEKLRKARVDEKKKPLFSFPCLRSREKSSEKLVPSFRVLSTRLSAYDDPHTNPIPVPPKSRHHDTPYQDTPLPRYKFLYPKVPENIPGTAGINSFSPTSTRIPTPGPKPKPAKQPKKVVSTSTSAPSPLPPRRVVKKLSSHLSRHPAVQGLMTQYPTVEMYEKRTGFDTYFDTPFIEYSHSYWTSLNRPPSPFKRTKPLKVKFESPSTKPKRAPTPGPGVAPRRIETYGPKRDLGADVALVDEYSYPYSPDDYEKRVPWGFARDSIEEVALLGGRKFSSSTERPRQPEMKQKPRVKAQSHLKVDDSPHVRFLSPTPSAVR